MINGLHLRSLGDYQQNHRVMSINKSRVQNHELQDEVMPPVNQKSP